MGARVRPAGPGTRLKEVPCVHLHVPDPEPERGTAFGFGPVLTGSLAPSRTPGSLGDQWQQDPVCWVLVTWRDREGQRLRGKMFFCSRSWV